MNCLRRHALDVIRICDADDKSYALRHWPQDLGVDPAAHWDEPAGVPGRPARPTLRPPREVPVRAMGTPEGRASLIHALAHIECNAMDLALDAIWRFSGMPALYYLDWLRVAQEEALHFALLHRHLQAMGYRYGDFDAHEGLWDMARRTQADLLARLAVVPRILEARGLDASPAVRHKLLSAGDRAGAQIIELILRDEIGHVAIGNHWFGWLCDQRGLLPSEQGRLLARQYGAPQPRGPFNLQARLAAGFAPQDLAELSR